MANTEMVPIEGNLGKLLVDVVRRCQSTVAENLGLQEDQGEYLAIHHDSRHLMQSPNVTEQETAEQEEAVTST